jgi:hypothetical protein
MSERVSSLTHDALRRNGVESNTLNLDLRLAIPPGSLTPTTRSDHATLQIFPGP